MGRSGCAKMPQMQIGRIPPSPRWIPQGRDVSAAAENDALPHDHAFDLDPSRQRLFDSQGRPLSFPTDGSTFPIGRADDARVRVQGDLVSRHHAEARWDKGQLWIRDRSSNGTWLNGKPVDKAEWVAVPHGGRLQFGSPQSDPLVLGVGGSETIMVRLDRLQKSPTQNPYFLSGQDGKALELPAEGKVVQVGRVESNEIRLPDSLTSARHASVVWQGGRLFVSDLNSTNGTYVNGRRVAPGEWTEVPPGGEVKFGSEQSKLKLQPRDPLVVTFFGDGSAADIGGQVKAQPRRFERALSHNQGQQASPALVRGLIARGSIAKDVAQMLLPVGMGALAVAGGAAAVAATVGTGGLPLALWGLATAGAGGWTAWASRHFFRGGKEAVQARLKDSAIAGTGWNHVKQVVVSKGPRLSQFQKLWKENLSEWPKARHVVYISGHGNAQGAAGLKFADLGQSVQGAEAIFLDACNGAQLESLTKLADSAKVAVASEHTVRGYGFPLDDMFGRKQLPENARDLGAALVQAATRSQPAESLVAVDLKVLKDKLLPALNDLGGRLCQLRQHRTAIKAALKEASRAQNGLNPKIDLGSFLSHLSRDPALRKDCPELHVAEKSLNQTILSMVGAGTLSFDRSPSGQDVPPAWRNFLKQY